MKRKMPFRRRIVTGLQRSFSKSRLAPEICIAVLDVYFNLFSRFRLVNGFAKSEGASGDRSVIETRRHDRAVARTGSAL
jgi:hypothetical protein